MLDNARKFEPHPLAVCDKETFNTTHIVNSLEAELSAPNPDEFFRSMKWIKEENAFRYFIFYTAPGETYKKYVSVSIDKDRVEEIVEGKFLPRELLQLLKYSLQKSCIDKQIGIGPPEEPAALNIYKEKL